MVKNMSFSLAVLEIEENSLGLRCIGIFSKSREEWLVTDYACILQSYTVVPIYDVFSEQEIIKIINENGITTIACGIEKVHVILKLRAQGTSGRVNTLICFDAITSYEITQAQSLDIQLLLYSDLTTQPSEGAFNMPRPDSIYTICYTSGVTGMPRGVKLSHSNAVACIGGIEANGFKLDPTDCYLSYMPLAHMMDRTFLQVFTYFGVRIGFYAGDIRNLIEDIASLRPTIFASVPRLFMVINETVNQRLSELSPFKKSMFRRGFATKLRNYQAKGKYTSKLWDSIVFNKIKAVLGGRIRLMISGSAALSPDVAKFLKVVFCCPLIEGYGQTETCAASFIAKSTDPETGHFGGPLPCVEFKLADVIEFRCFHTDTDSQGLPQPRGELCIRGPTVSVGYLDPDLQMTDAEGWLHTGDICMLLPSNLGLTFIGRNRNIFKLSQGEFFSPEKLEAVYGRSAFVSQIVVYGDSFHSFLVAVILPCEDYVRTYWEPSIGRAWEDICKDPGLEGEILGDLALEARKTQLMGIEYVRKIKLVHEPLPEQLLTPTQKLKRSEAYDYYRDMIDSLY